MAGKESEEMGEEAGQGYEDASGEGAGYTENLPNQPTVVRVMGLESYSGFWIPILSQNTRMEGMA